ncbi:MAG: hypothetical protein ACE5GM_06785 [bacterium]
MKRFKIYIKGLLSAFFLLAVLLPTAGWAGIRGRVYLLAADYIDLAEGHRLSKNLHITNRADYSYAESQAKILVINGNDTRVFTLASLTGIPQKVVDRLTPGNMNLNQSLIKKIDVKRINFPAVPEYRDPDLQDNYIVKESKKSLEMMITQKFHQVRPTYSGNRLVRNVTRVWNFKFKSPSKKESGKGSLKVTDDNKAIGPFGFAFLTGMEGKVKAYYLGKI